MIDTGGPAYPGPCTKPLENYYPGMTMRDYFAARAMQGFATTLSGMSTINYELLAADAYQMADAMINERNKP